MTVLGYLIAGVISSSIWASQAKISVNKFAERYEQVYVVETKGLHLMGSQVKKPD